MNSYIGKIFSNFRVFYNEINSATLTGAIDVIVVQQPDGSFMCSPFHVRFGKIGVLRSKEKIVDIELNGEPIDIHMKLGENGEAIFIDNSELPANDPKQQQDEEGDGEDEETVVENEEDTEKKEQKLYWQWGRIPTLWWRNQKADEFVVSPRPPKDANLRLTSEQIASLNLKRGPNEVVFSVTTAYQGTTRCMCIIYLWQYDDKIVVSDIDGTITKSDVLGQLLPYVGKDWAQSGVAPLFTKIFDNGYKFLYLSARAIGQSRSTRDYLRSVKQDDVRLPDGPLLLSPTSLLSAFHREVIEKKPEIFKISCLEDIKSLFPSNPFFAGFGNKINDAYAYKSVEIPRARTFTINHNGVLTLELPHTFQSSYTYLSDVVDQMFPPLKSFVSEYGQFTYWRDPIRDLFPSELDGAKSASEISK